MSLLITGGLLLVALIAIIGVVLLMISDRSRSGPQLAPEQARVSAVPPEQVDQPNHVAAIEGPTVLLYMDGQFSELVHEIHNLHQQAVDLEDRLRTLKEMAERIEREQNNQQLDFKLESEVAR